MQTARSQQDQVVVTGMGVLSPVGNSARAAFDALVRGESGIARIEPALDDRLDVQIAGLVKDFDATAVLGRKHARRHARFTHLALGAAQQATAQAGLAGAGYDCERIGVVFGTSMGGLDIVIDAAHILRDRGPAKMSPFALSASLPNIAAAMIAEVFAARGPSRAAVSACASGAEAIGEAMLMLRSGRADVVIAGGTESVVVPSAIASFSQMQALSRRNAEPASASRPFDRGRDGFVLAEGAAALVLERGDRARARGAVLHGEIAGYGSTCDAFHVTKPREDGAEARRAMQLALADARLAKEEVAYVNAHGTATLANDLMETRAIRGAFGAHADALWVSSTKGASGHMLGAAGAFEAIVCLLSLATGIVPPTINLDDPDPLCDLDFVPREARRRTFKAALSNSFAFGGHNVCLAFRAV